MDQGKSYQKALSHVTAESASRESDPAAMGRSVVTVPMTANRFSYFLQRARNFEYWSVCSSVVLTEKRWRRALFEKALLEVVSAQDGLRLRLERSSGVWRQWTAPIEEVRPLMHVRTERVFGSTELMQEIEDHLQVLREGFHFPGDLFRVLAIELADGRAILAIVAHHVVVDADGVAIVQDELFTAYERLAAGQSALSLMPPTSYVQFARASIRYWLDSQARVLQHWRSLPWDRVQALPERLVDDREHALEERYTSVVRVPLQNAPSVHGDSFWLTSRYVLITRVLVAITRAYRRWTGQRVLHLAMVCHGREPFGRLDLRRTAGWMSSTVPLLLDTDFADPELLKEAGRQIRMAQAIGSSYNTLRYLAEDPHVLRELAAHPIPGLSLNVVLPSAQCRSLDRIAQPLKGISVGSANLPDTRRVFPISGGLFVHEGRLILSWDFSNQLITSEEADRFAWACVDEFDRLTSCEADRSPRRSPRHQANR